MTQPSDPDQSADGEPPGGLSKARPPQADTPREEALLAELVEPTTSEPTPVAPASGESGRVEPASVQRASPSSERPQDTTNPYRDTVPRALEAELVPVQLAFEAPEQEPRRMHIAARLLIMCGGFFAVQLVIGIVVGLGLVVYLAATDGFNEETVTLLESDDLALQMTMLAAAPLVLLTLALVFVCRRWLDKRDIASMGFFWPPRGLVVTIIGGVLAGLAPIGLATALIYAWGGYEFDGFSWSVMGLLLIPTLVLMAFQEEILFRSYVYQNILEERRPMLALWFSSVVFWLMHAFNPNAWSSPFIGVNLFLAGVLLALAYRLSRDIWFPSAMHFGWNFAQGVLFSIPISGIRVEGFLLMRETDDAPSWLTGGAFGLEGSLLTALIQVVLIAGMSLALSRRSSTTAANVARRAEDLADSGRERSGAT